MVKLEPIKSVNISNSSSSSSSSSSDDDSDSDDRQSTSSSDSDLSLIETSRVHSLKSCQKRQLPTSVHLIPQGTILHDTNNNQWIIHQCLQISDRNERFIYLCSQMKRSLSINDIKISEENLVKIKISPCINLPDKFKQSRQTMIKKLLSENDKIDSIFYGNIIGEKNKEIQFIYPNNHSEKSIISTINKFLSSAINNPNGNKILYGIIEFFKGDQSNVNKYAVEIYFQQDKINWNFVTHPYELLEQILIKEIDKLKELREKNLKIADDYHRFSIKQKPGNDQYEISESLLTEPDYSSSIKYLLKLELTPSTSSKTFTIDDEISFYSRFATHDKLKSYIKRHNLMYIAIPEYISHGIYKHMNSTYKFLIMEQYRENLRSLISSYDQSLPEHNALNLFLQMLYVLQFLHEKNYVHQIIKPKYMMFTNKQPYFIYLTQFRTVKNINESNEVPQENFPIKKKVKHTHRTQLTSIHNKTSSIVPSLLPVIDVPSPIIEDENLLVHSATYYHPFSVYSSLDLHLNNKQTYRGDLEMLGYNLIVWSGGRLPWDRKNSSKHLKFNQYTITNEKKLAKSNVNEFVKKCFFMKLISPVTLRAICDYMSTVYQFNSDDIPNFDQLRAPIKEIVKALGFKANACLRLSNSKSKASNVSINHRSTPATNSQLVKTNGNSTKQINVSEIQSAAKEFEVEHEDLEDEDEDDDDDDDDDDDEDDYEDETHRCPPDSSSCEDNDEEHSSNDNDDAQMEQQAPTNPGKTVANKCTRCGGDHSLDDQQSQTSSDKQSSNNNSLNTLTYQQKRQRSIAKRLQLRRKNKH